MKFFKYQGTGNDFIIFDDRNRQFPMHNRELVAQLCNRRFGIGADGLMLLQNETGFDFRMVYYNADGGESSMCGNGGRCMARFAQQLGMVQNKTTFVAIDGSHEAVLDEKEVWLRMNDVITVEKDGDNLVLDTGSPHYVISEPQISELDIITRARQIRYNNRFREKGINVNFIAADAKGIAVRTYERGVEDETLSCGTGVTASAIAWAVLRNKLKPEPEEVQISTPGGSLRVTFTWDPATNSFGNIWLIGPATLVYSGEISF